MVVKRADISICIDLSLDPLLLSYLASEVVDDQLWTVLAKMMDGDTLDDDLEMPGKLL